MKSFGTWPYYSVACRKDVDALLKRGGSLSAYRASSAFPDWKGPAKDSWAWRLEREIEKRFRVKHAVAVNSGTAALHASLYGLHGQRPQQRMSMREMSKGEVITTPYTFSATASSILLAGFTPVFADIDPYTFCITKETVKRVLTKKTKAVLPVHLFGGLADLDSLKTLGVLLVEDACQAVGAVRDGVYSGGYGIAGAYSFNGTKNVPCGEGGALVTNSEAVASNARMLVNHGENFGSTVGYNYRINEVTACIAWHGLVELEQRNRERQELARYLTGSWVSFHGDADEINAPLSSPAHAFYTYPIMPRYREGRSRFISRMKRRGYAVQAGYTQPLHTLPAFRKYQRCPLPVVEDVHKRIVLLNNVRPPSTVKDMQEMAKAMRESLR